MILLFEHNCKLKHAFPIITKNIDMQSQNTSLSKLFRKINNGDPLDIIQSRKKHRTVKFQDGSEYIYF